MLQVLPAWVFLSPVAFLIGIVKQVSQKELREEESTAWLAREPALRRASALELGGNSHTFVPVTHDALLVHGPGGQKKIKALNPSHESPLDKNLYCKTRNPFCFVFNSVCVLCPTPFTLAHMGLMD